ncbi:Phosphoglycerate mutase family member 5 [Intoshia linei]|uniref:Serine/threonine-protein phosphatase PGAM5, mitochondrial n=1 Tax=Intoshia linei TaxID=1819745 RepID=A0A177B0U8_9BILA|nr:Phosphoglycerate mutase family member 5 [Intoshia linei]
MLKYAVLPASCSIFLKHLNIHADDTESIKNAWNENWDRKKNETSDIPRYRHIYLVRHGQYEYSKYPYKLTSLGKKQANLVGKRLSQYVDKFDKVYHSTMVRAKETCGIIEKEILQKNEAVACNLLEEGYPVPPEPPIFPDESDRHYYVNGQRIETAFRNYFSRPAEGRRVSNELIVCHANVIRYFICRLLQVNPNAWLRMCLSNCSITRVTICANGRIIIRHIGEDSFFNKQNISLN